MLTVQPNINRQMAQRMLVDTSTRMATPADLAQSEHALLAILLMLSYVQEVWESLQHFVHNSSCSALLLLLSCTVAQVCWHGQGVKANLQAPNPVKP